MLTEDGLQPILPPPDLFAQAQDVAQEADLFLGIVAARRQRQSSVMALLLRRRATMSFTSGSRRSRSEESQLNAPPGD